MNKTNDNNDFNTNPILAAVSLLETIESLLETQWSEEHVLRNKLVAAVTTAEKTCAKSEETAEQFKIVRETVECNFTAELDSRRSLANYLNTANQFVLKARDKYL